jgi:hypothetical protein
MIQLIGLVVVAWMLLSPLFYKLLGALLFVALCVYSPVLRAVTILLTLVLFIVVLRTNYTVLF